jgi:hypothetical protein
LAVFAPIVINSASYPKVLFKKNILFTKLIAMRKTLFIYRLVFVLALSPVTSAVLGQATFPENGVVDPRHGTYAFTNATIVKDVATTLNNATMVIKDGKIISVGTSVKVPNGAATNCRCRRWRWIFWPTTIYFKCKRSLWLEPGN